MGKKKTHEEFINGLEKVNKNIEVLGKYVNARTKIKCICKIDGYEWCGTPDNLLKGVGCPKCGGSIRKTNKEFLEIVNKLNPMIEVLTEYKNNRSRINCRCKIDLYEWSTMAAVLLGGGGCPKCAGKLRKTHAEFLSELEVVNPNIIILSDYSNYDTNIRCRCAIDGYEWNATPNNLLSGKGCSECKGGKRKTHNKFIKELKNVNRDVEVLEEYKSANTKMKFRCLKDGYEWVTVPDSLLQGSGCPKCSSSRGERYVGKYCEKNKIKYKTQYKLDGCKNINKLPFDFALFNENSILCLIEYQGKQHYEPIEIFGGEKQFKTQQKHDKIKRDFCKLNNIPLIEIPYWESDIEKFLNKKLDDLDINIQLSMV